MSKSVKKLISSKVSPELELLSEDLQAKGHSAVRQAHETEIAEDYVEVIDDLIRAQGEARAIDISRRLGVTHVTVTKTIGRLQRDGLVETQPYRSIFLTKSGKELAFESRKRHQIVVEFLKALGVSEETAHTDAEGIEHHVSKETLKIFERFAKKHS